MTENEKIWVDLTRANYFGDLLARRHPEIKDPDNRLGALAIEFGAETVLNIADALEGLLTPEPSIQTLGEYTVFKFYSGLARASQIPSEVQ